MSQSMQAGTGSSFQQTIFTRKMQWICTNNKVAGVQFLFSRCKILNIINKQIYKIFRNKKEIDSFENMIQMPNNDYLPHWYAYDSFSIGKCIFFWPKEKKVCFGWFSIRPLPNYRLGIDLVVTLSPDSPGWKPKPS